MRIRLYCVPMIATALVIGGVVSAPSRAEPTLRIPSGGGTPHAGQVPSQFSTGVQAAAPLAAPAAAPAGFPVRGIDVASYQGNVNWGRVASAGDSFAYAKATEGTSYTNPYFNGQYHGAKNAGLFAGAYVFARPDAPNPKAQADYFVNQAQFANDGRTLPLMLDLEWPYSGTGVTNACWNLKPAGMVSWIHAFVNEVRFRTGRPMLIYTSPYWWNPCTGNSTAFGDQWLNVPYWHTTPPTLLPEGWSRWMVWQYSDSGSLPGDQDVFNGNLNGLRAFARSDPGITSPAAVSPAGRVVDVFYKGGDGGLWHAWNLGGGWGGPSAMNFGTLGGQPAVVEQPNGSIDIFWRGLAGALWHAWRNGGVWNGPVNMGGVLTGDPTAVLTGGGTMAVFYRGGNGPPWVQAFYGGIWHPEQRLSASVVSSQPAAVGLGGGRADVFFRGTNNQLWHTFGGNGHWPGITSLHGTMTSGPAVVQRSAGALDVFYRGANGNLWHSWSSSGRWSGPQQALNSGTLGSGPAPVTKLNGTITEVFWKGVNHGVWHAWFNGHWNGPQLLGGEPVTTPTAVLEPSGIIDVFFNNNIRTLGHFWLTSGGWNGPQNLGGFLS